MRGFYHKGRKLHKIIAFLLAVILTIVPLLSHAGGKGNSEASGSYIPSFHGEYKIDDLTPTDFTWQTVSGAADEYVLTLPSKTMMMYRTATNLDDYTLEIAFQFPSTITVQKDGTDYTCTVKYYYVNGSELGGSDSYANGNSFRKEDVEDSVTGLHVISNTGTITIGKANQSYAYSFLAKPELPTDYFNSPGAGEPADNDHVGYCKIGMVGTQNNASDFANFSVSVNLKCQNGSGGSDFVNKTNSYCEVYAEGNPLTSNVPNQETYVGKAKYTYVYHEDNTLDTSTVTFDSAVWTDTFSLSKDQISTDGYYYGFIGYFDDNDHLLGTRTLSKDPVKMDVTPPEVPNDLKVTNSSTEVTGNFYVNETTYMVTSAPYMISCTPSEACTVFCYYSTDGGASWNTLTDYATGQTVYGSSPVNFTIKWSDIGTESTIYALAFRDNALGGASGNMTGKENIPNFSLCRADDNPKIDSIKVVDSAHQEVTWEELRSDGGTQINYFNDSYFFEVQASSGSEITELSLQYNCNCEGATEAKSETISSISSTLDAASGRYLTTQYLPLCAAGMENKNYTIKESQFTVKDQKTKEATVTSSSHNGLDDRLFYSYLHDVTKPKISLSDANDNTAWTAIDNIKWYQSFVLGYEITRAETGSENESGFAQASYTVDGGASTALSLTETETGKLKDTIEVEESKTVAGSSYVFDAEDLSGNKLDTTGDPHIVTIKVDKTDPEVQQLTVDGSENPGHSLSKADDIAIGAKLRDNLTLANVTFEVTYPDGTSKKKEFSINAEAADENGIVQFYNTTLQEITDETDFANGLYTVKVTVTDQSGRTSSERTVQFQIDNSLKIDRILLVDENHNPVALNDLNQENNTLFINKQYYLQVTASSGSKMTEMGVQYTGITAQTSLGKTFDSVISITDSDHGINQMGRYSVTKEIPLLTSELSNETVNAILKDLTVYVRDETMDTVSVKGTAAFGDERTLWDYFYDETKPMISFHTMDGGAIDTEKWYPELQLGYEITQGEMSSGPESALKSAVYSVDGGEAVDLLGGSRAETLSGYLDAAESQTIAGTGYVFDASDLSGNVLQKENGENAISLKVDKTNPAASAPLINGEEHHFVALTTAEDIRVSAQLSDNLTLSQVTFEVTYPDGSVAEKSFTMDYDADGTNKVTAAYYTTLAEIAGNSDFPDGDYRVAVTATDKAGRRSETIASRFEIDNTAPVLSMEISEGKDGGKEPLNYYFGTDVTVELVLWEKNIDLANAVAVADNGSTVPLEWEATSRGYVAYYTTGSAGLHTVSFSATDRSGTAAQPKTLSFVIDKTAPSVTTIVNGVIVYAESMGSLNMLGDVTIGVSVTDETADDQDLNFRVVQKKPDQAATTPDYMKTANRSFRFNEEADYTVSFFAVDMAGNTSQTRNVSFRIDKTAPEITISGISGNTSSNITTITFGMKEAFWWDAEGTVTIYRKARDGSEEELLKTIDFVPTAYETNLRETFSDTGIYRLEFAAADSVGHRVNKSQTFTVDREAPKITLSGVNNYDVTSQTVDFFAEITDDFYLSKKVSVKGTRTDMNGKKNNIEFPSFSQSGNPSIISESFSEDGIYDIEITSVDVAGNSHTSSVHFTIDKTAPAIGDLSAYDGAVLREFNWDIDLDTLVSDLTVCDVHMYLNGSEYDGVSEIEDGSYILLITAEDELGQYSEKSVEFVLDTRAPVFIVTGVEDGEAKNEPYDIGVSLQLDEDTLTSVTLNGKEMTINENVSSFSVTEKGDYTLTMKAKDAAGNEAENTIKFYFGEEKVSGSHWWIWVAAAGGGLALLFLIIFVIRKVRHATM